ncbi:hypothetical protein PTSG_06708 [Salpingoeca rosetta]|uniref:NADH:ubiquinone oxidoreductase intermediate-associated protein 30 domain-containing protein n=1 Tax=Salpingoeca rosetta (strain ATCC 50818 / BSB-021) TaxID=946362 RepID=F2UEK1_SALR5|nr:uncharacterized protein PTSG_06708 [Salpingoeca rosetta]EGD75051.1 hypothetical protein PTSG_06708 [Salpingoeca rosetta]|eukprot:XP_004992104.1 hypothetical protein PTSG_06708 [Salpingoeca rosetta]
MLLTLLGMLANMVRALHTKTVRVSHRLTCISDGTERPLVGKSTCFHRLDVATLHWHGNLAAIRSSRPQPFGNTGSGQPRHQPEAFSPVSSPSSPLSSSSPASPSSFSPTSSSAESPAEPSSPTWSSAQHMTFHPVPTPLLPRRTYADAARNGRAQNGHATATHSGVVGKPEKEQQQQQQQQQQVQQIPPYGTATAFTPYAGSRGAGGDGDDGHVLVGFCQVTQELGADSVPSRAWGVCFTARASALNLVFAVIVHVDESHLQAYRRQKQREVQQELARLQRTPGRRRSSARTRRQPLSGRTRTSVGSIGNEARTRNTEGTIAYVAYFRPTTEFDSYCLRFSDFTANQRGRHLPDAPALKASAITRIGFSITRSTQTIEAEEGDVTPFDLYMKPAWHFVI